MTNRDPALMSEAERRAEVARILATGYRRFVVARNEKESRDDQ